MASEEMSKSQFLEALGLLNTKLQNMDEQITFLCVGGAVMLLVLGARNSTADIDGAIQPSDKKNVFYKAVEEVAEDLGIHSTWINNQVQIIMGAQGYRKEWFAPDPRYRWSNLNLLFAKPGYMLSLKCQSMRSNSKDLQDIISLLRVLKIKSIQGVKSEISKYGTEWSFLGNDEHRVLELCLAWAFPGQTEYDSLRVEALRRKQRAASGPNRMGRDSQQEAGDRHLSASV